MSEDCHRFFLSLGSNIEPAHNIPAALGLLMLRLEIRAASRVFETEPVAENRMPVFPGFLNAALEGRSMLNPRELKYGVLRQVEKELGRERSSNRNAPRTIDIDIALFGAAGEWIVDQPGVVLPDPDILTRAHVATPLADLAPDLQHPVDGRTLGRIAAGLGREGIRLDRDPEVLRRMLVTDPSSSVPSAP